MMTKLTSRNVAHIVFKRRRLFVGIFVAALALYAGLVLTQASRYESDASVLVKLNDQDVATPDLISEQQARGASISATMAEQQINSELLLFKSRDVLAATVNKVGLDTLYPGLTQQANDAGIPPMDLAVDKLNKDLDVEVNANTNVLLLSLLNVSPIVARQALTSLIGEALDKQAEVTRDPRLSFLQKRLAALRKESDAAQDALLKFKDKAHITSLDKERTLLLQQRDTVQGDLNQLEAKLASDKDQKSILEATRGKTDANVALTNENDSTQKQIDDARDRVSSAEAAYEAAKLRFADGNPELLDARAQYQVAKRILHRLQKEPATRIRSGVNPVYEKLTEDLTDVSADIEGTQAAIGAHKDQLTKIDARLSYLNSNETALSDLEHRRDVADQEFRSYLERAQSARIVTDMNEAGITALSVLQQPSLPYKPARPRKLLLLALTLFVGLTAGLGVCLGLETLDDRISLSDQVEPALGLPLLAAINLHPSE
jgi:uncharacterized protein involved in exopolysaccharide biosynthesis